MASRGSCRRVWLCATDDKTDLCFEHYHTCWRANGHIGECDSASGPGHHAGNRIGDVVNSVVEAYAQMRQLGWK